MHGAAEPEIRRIKVGRALTEQGTEAGDLFLLLDGVLVVEVDGVEMAEVGPGAVVGERAVLEGGVRTATLRARTLCRVAAVPVDAIDRQQLLELAGGHRREEQG
jgi:CRP-like cAMP-binding protein